MSRHEHLTGNDNYFDNFAVGDVYRHARGKTITENEAVTICHLVLNTAEGHFNDDLMARAHAAGMMKVDRSLVFGGVTISVTIGLAYQDTGEQVIREIAMDNMKLLEPVVHGDTIYSYTEVLEREDVDESSGKVTFRHYGVNHRDQVVFQGDRSALVRKRPAS
ncbi:MAG: MaoC family dehydratase [Pseudomonadota bacterium]